jgi:hypothetical protein
MAFPPSEIDPEVDFDSRRAVYFRQMRYGLFVRCNSAMDDVFKLITFPPDPYGIAYKRHGLSWFEVSTLLVYIYTTPTHVT